MPFSVEQFFDVFESYNRATGPAAVILTMLASVAVLAMIWRSAMSTRLVLLILAALWTWAGGVYHLLFFTEVNPAAWIFGTAFMIEASLLAWAAFGQPLRIKSENRAAKIVSTILVIYALLIYPMLTAASGHSYPRFPTFGCPCPVTIFTFGMLISLKVPWYTAIIPMGWAIVGTSAAAYFNIYADLGLIASAAAFVFSKAADRFR
jgi:hypothetical protein